MTTNRVVFEMPSTVFYEDVMYKLTSPSNLMRALNRDEKTLLDIFDLGDIENVVENVRIERRRVVADFIPTERRRLKDEAREKITAARRVRLCAFCGKVDTIKSRTMRGTCSQDCLYSFNRQIGQSIANTHWVHSPECEKIMTQRTLTRKAKDAEFQRTYTPWNKGKTGIYSPETIQKIAAATQRQFHSERIRKTSIEKKFENLLQEMGLNYKYSFMLCRRQYDFFLPDYKIVVEIHGDFWHGNPAVYGTIKPLREHQKMKRLDDLVKKRIATESGYRYVEFWELEFNQSFDKVRKVVEELVK